MKFPLQRHDPTHAERKWLGAFDIETRGLGGEILAVGWQTESDSEPQLSTNPQDLVNAFLRRYRKRVIWYGHNAGGFDLLHLMPYLRNTDCDIYPIWQGKSGRCIGMVLKRGRERCELRDSFALVPSSLAKMAETLAPDLPKLVGTIDFEREIYDHQNPNHRAYLARDVTSLLASMIRLWEITRETFGVWPKWTLGSTAIAAWTLTLGDDEVYWPSRPTVEQFARLAYFGGLVFLRWFGTKPNVSAADVNAMYPSVMRDFTFPVGMAWRTDKFDPNRLGIYHIRAVVPPSVKLPMLPLRHPSGVKWPHGVFETYATTPEIRYAKSLGCVVTILTGYVWQDQRHLFSTFVNAAEQLRREHINDSVSATVKNLQNSLYGKFGAKREAEDTLVSDDFDQAIRDGWNIIIDPKTGNPIDGLYSKPKAIDAAYIQPHWAVYVTAYARIRLHKLIMAIGIDRVWYGDTDSVWADTDAITDAIAAGRVRGSPWHYGDVKLEGPYPAVEWIASKVYAIMDDRGLVATAKAKGIPKKQIANAIADRTLQIHWESVTSMRALLHGAKALTSMRKRIISSVRSSKSWVLSEDGHTVLPVEVNVDIERDREQWQRQQWEIRQERLMRRQQWRELRQRILAAGGIRKCPDYSNWPRSVTRKSGQMPDVVASLLGFDRADDLMAEVAATYC